MLLTAARGVFDLLMIDDIVECLAMAVQAFVTCNNPSQVLSQSTFIISAPEVHINEWTSTDMANHYLAAYRNNNYIYDT
uniref:Uncharacterized protein n=1 Tax=Ditylenchus dipsaci TaxID=166011 RepID=A0A915D6C1_9BILA